MLTLNKLLLFEDNPDHEELFMAYLEMTRFGNASVTCTPSLEQGRQLLTLGCFDIAFLDLSLTDSNYHETLEQIGSLTSSCPVVVLTSLDDRDTMMSIINKGADDCLNKSDLNEATLERTIQYNLDRWQMRKELNAERWRLKEIIWGTNVGTWEWNIQTGEVQLNERWAEIIGYTLEELAPISIETWEHFVHPDDLEQSDKLLKRHFDGEIDHYECEVRMQHRQGHWVWVLDRGKVVEWNKDGQPLRASGTHTDITERKQAEEELQLAAHVFSDTHEGIAITDADGFIIDVNPTFCEITEYSREDVIGQKPSILSSGKHDAQFYARLWGRLLEHGHWRGEIWNRKKGGELYAERLTISATYDKKGNIRNYIGLFTDITQIKHQQHSLELMAHYDVLTKLPNRTLFADRFSQAIARSRRNETLLAIGFLDLDGFKPVNDTYGHEAGDHLLVEVAERIKATLRENDTVSRQGGDEFTLLLGDFKSIKQCRNAISRIHQKIAKPYLIDDHPVHISASSGFTIFPLEKGDPDTLLRQADQAMYQAKLEGKNRYRLSAGIRQS